LSEKTLSEFRVLLFDLDDTLYPERSFVISGFHAVGAWLSSHLGLPADEVAEAFLSLHDGGARGDTFDRWLQNKGLDAGTYLDQLVNVYRRHMPSIKPFDAVPDLLQRFRASRRLGLVTDGFYEVQSHKLSALDIGRYFDVAVFSDELGREAWKPSTKPFEKALSMLGTPPEAAVYIADNPLKDFLGARQLGMETIRVRYSDGYYARCEPPTPQHAPDHQVGKIEEIEGIVVGK
jgi:putative hydrolase of the HAD superfamily